MDAKQELSQLGVDWRPYLLEGAFGREGLNWHSAVEPGAATVAPEPAALDPMTGSKIARKTCRRPPTGTPWIASAIASFSSSDAIRRLPSLSSWTSSKGSAAGRCAQRSPRPQDSPMNHWRRSWTPRGPRSTPTGPGPCSARCRRRVERPSRRCSAQSARIGSQRGRRTMVRAIAVVDGVVTGAIPYRWEIGIAHIPGMPSRGLSTRKVARALLRRQSKLNS